MNDWQIPEGADIRPGDRTTGKGDRVYICEPMWKYLARRFWFPVVVFLAMVVVFTITGIAAYNQW